MPDLWPADIAKTIHKTPVSILREQAALLGEKTKNLVEAEVAQNDVYNSSDFRYDFFIVGPALQNYHYKLFTISHPVELYPVRFFLDRDIVSELNLGKGDVAAEVDDENTLLDFLKKIFASKKTRQVIAAILGQSTDSAQYVEDVNDIPF
jgi:hypothetical protein